MNPVISEIYETADHALLQSAISPAEGELIDRAISENDVTSSVEIGCADGLSSLFICDALSRRPNPRHIIIDPYQTEHYGSRGVANLKRAGFDFFELIEKPSELALPTLLQTGTEFDFALIDGFHTFDHTMLDFFYLNRMLRVGGLIAIDDVNMASVHKVVRYIFNYPCYRLYAAANVRGRQRRMLNSYKMLLGKCLRPLTWVMGENLSHELFDASLVRSDLIAAIDYSTMVIFEKIEADARSSLWYEHF